MVSSGSSLGSATLRLTADGGDLEKGIRSAGQKAGELGRVLTGLGVAFVAPAAIGIRTFAQFEQRMANVQAVSGATGTEFASSDCHRQGNGPNHRLHRQPVRRSPELSWRWLV